MLRVKITIPGAGENINLSQFTGNLENIVNNCKFFINEECKSPDVWLVIEDLDLENNKCLISPDKIAFLSAESAWPVGYYSETPQIDVFLNQFAHFYTCHEINRDSSNSELPFLPWMINANHGPSIFANHSRNIEYFKKLERIAKPKSLSVFCSNQQWTENHRMRFRFTSRLKEHFKDRLDWYGNGVQKLEQKWDGLAPYKYSLVLENTSRNLVMSEKIYDSFLTLTYPIYWGSNSASEFFNPKSFSSIDIFDFKGSVQIIEQILHEDPYEQALPYILESKEKVLGELNFANRLCKVANSVVQRSETSPKQLITLYSKEELFRRNREPRKINRRLLGRAVKKFGSLIEG